MTSFLASRFFFGKRLFHRQTLDYQRDNQAFVVLMPLSIFIILSIYRQLLFGFDVKS
jgi:hypothetical protein